MIHVRNVGSVAHQPTGLDILAIGIDRGNCMARRERCKLNTPTRKEPLGGNKERVGPVPHESGEGRLDLPAGTGFEDLNLQPYSACSFRYVSKRGVGSRDICWIDQHGNTNGLWDQFVQEP